MNASNLPTELVEDILNKLDLKTVINYCKQNQTVAQICRQNQDKLAVRLASEVPFVQDKDVIINYIKNGLNTNAFTASDVIKAIKKLTILYNYMISQNKTALMYGLYDQIMIAINKMKPEAIKVYFKILQQYFTNQLESPKFKNININTDI